MVPAVLGVLLVLLILFYRPLGHWALLHFGSEALEKAGVTGTWKTSCTLLTGLSIDQVKMTGNDVSQIRSITMEHAKIDYALWALRGAGPGAVLKD